MIQKGKLRTNLHRGLQSMEIILHWIFIYTEQSRTINRNVWDDIVKSNAYINLYSYILTHDKLLKISGLTFDLSVNLTDVWFSLKKKRPNKNGDASYGYGEKKPPRGDVLWRWWWRPSSCTLSFSFPCWPWKSSIH